MKRLVSSWMVYARATVRTCHRWIKEAFACTWLTCWLPHCCKWLLLLEHRLLQPYCQVKHHLTALQIFSSRCHVRGCRLMTKYICRGEYTLHMAALISSLPTACTRLDDPTSSYDPNWPSHHVHIIQIASTVPPQCVPLSIIVPSGSSLVCTCKDASISMILCIPGWTRL